MRIISRKALVDHWSLSARADSKTPLEAWYAEAKRAAWTKPSDIEARYGSASFVGDRVASNIAGNKYRLIVRVHYGHGIVYVRFVGTHREYDDIDAAEV